METKTITRRNKLGYAWSNSPVQSRPGLVVPMPTKPEVEGTVRECVAAHRHAAKFNSGGVCWSRAWFVRVDGEWRRLKSANGSDHVSSAMCDLADGMLGINSVDVAY